MWTSRVGTLNISKSKYSPRRPVIPQYMNMVVLTVKVTNGLIEVKGEKWLWKFSEEEFDEDSSEMRITMRLQINLMT